MMPAEGQALRGGKGHGLAVDGQSAPAHDGGGGDESGASRRKGGGAGDHLQRTKNGRRQWDGRQGGQDPEEDNEGTDSQRRGQRVGHGGGQGLGEGNGFGRQGAARQGGAPGLGQAAKEPPCEQGGGNVDQIQPDAQPCVTQNARANVAKQKSRAAVVAEAQQQLRLLPGYPALGVKAGGGFGSAGIAAQQSRQQGQGAFPAHPEQGPHTRAAQAAEGLRQPQLEEQGDCREKGEQGRDHRPAAEGQAVPDSSRRLLGTEKQHNDHGGHRQDRKQFFHSYHR